jgi:hypothetical protein
MRARKATSIPPGRHGAARWTVAGDGWTGTQRASLSALLDDVSPVYRGPAVGADAVSGMRRTSAFRADGDGARDPSVLAPVAKVDLGHLRLDVLVGETRLLTDQLLESLGNEGEPVDLGFQSKNLSLHSVRILSGISLCSPGGLCHAINLPLLVQIPNIEQHGSSVSATAPYSAAALQFRLCLNSRK